MEKDVPVVAWMVAESGSYMAEIELGRLCYGIHRLQHLYLSAAEFKRLCGVSRDTFGQMVEVLRPHLERQGQWGGQNKLSTEDQLLVRLEYWREYRSQFHIATTWGLDETTVGRIVKKVEDLRFIKCGKFRLPSKRQMY